MKLLQKFDTTFFSETQCTIKYHDGSNTKWCP